MWYHTLGASTFMNWLTEAGMPGVTRRYRCEALKAQDKRTVPQPEDAQAVKPAPRSPAGAGNLTEAVTEAEAAACVDMMWPNTPSILKQAHVRHIMQSKAARRPATAPVATMLASYDPSEGLTSHPDMEGVSVVQTMSAAGVSIIYLGSPDDTGVVSPEKTGELQCSVVPVNVCLST